MNPSISNAFVRSSGLSRRSLVAVAGALVAWGVSSTASAAEFTMRISHQFPPTHHTALNLEQFAKDVKAATKGRVEVQNFGAAQLFKPNQNHPAVASGKIEAAAMLSFQWGGSIPEMSVTIIPYLMTSVAKQKAFIGSEASRLLDAKMEAKGVKNIAWIVDTNDGIFTSNSKPLVTPADFAGLKIRGLNKLFDAGLSAMGAAPSAMPGSEVYQALQTGVLDAGFTGVKAAHSRKFYEVQKFGVASNIILAYDNLVVNPAWWNGLPPDVRAAIQKAADAAVKRSILTKDGVPAEDVKVLNDSGMKTIALTKAQEKAVADAMQPAVKKEFLSATAPDGVKLLELIDRL
ncbi:MAG: TRAP transporter substrate-binding protein DctP [Ramlibacter sp.]|nr:TRAP transporter substrate-binding protein DctP [Ramlibacter sp.]